MDLSYLKAAEGTCPPADLPLSPFSEFFNEYKNRKLERPDLLIKLGMVAYGRGGDGVDVHALDEALFNAGVEVGDLKLAEACLARLKKKFPDSVRVGVLEGKYLECTDQHAKALVLYDVLLGKNMASLPVMKRKVCVFKAQGKMVKAAEELQTILTTFPNEPSCWHELAELYMRQGEYDKAAHCCEELVLVDPNAANNHNRLADCYYSLGCSKGSSGKTGAGGNAGVGGLDAENLLLARQHYAMSLEREDASQNLHAVYGLAAAAKAIFDCSEANSSSSSSSGGGGGKSTAHAAAVNRELLAFSVEKLQSANMNYI